MPSRVFGHIPGYPVGSHFESRTELLQAGLHRPLIAGISGSEREGADSVVLSGGYEDDQDFGDAIIYTGHGGRDQESGKQIADQNFSRGNRALAYSSLNDLPVRVIRGASHNSPYSPGIGYSYDGLFMVDGYWQEIGRSGFRVWRYKLVKIVNGGTQGESVSETPSVYSVASRQETIVRRIVRNVVQAQRLKALYGYRCQVCGVRLEGLAGPYAEAAHIRPLGEPHNGPDALENMLCLCPNHHVLFDHGGIAIDENLSLIGGEESLTVHPHHLVNEEHLRYRREHYRAKL